MTDLEALKKYSQQADANAFRHLVLTYQGLVRAVCSRFLRDPADVDDATQDTFIKLARNAGMIKSNVASWLHSCAHATALDRVRSNIAREKRENSWADDNSPLPAPQHYHEIVSLLDQTLEELPPQERELLIQYYFLNRPLHEVGKGVGISRFGIKKRINKALNLLRERMLKKGVTLGIAALILCLSHASVSAAPLPAGLTLSLVKLGMAGVGQPTAVVTSLKTTSLSLAALIKTLVCGLVVASVVTGMTVFWRQNGQVPPSPIVTAYNDRAPSTLPVDSSNIRPVRIEVEFMDLNSREKLDIKISCPGVLSSQPRSISTTIEREIRVLSSNETMTLGLSWQARISEEKGQIRLRGDFNLGGLVLNEKFKTVWESSTPPKITDLKNYYRIKHSLDMLIPLNTSSDILIPVPSSPEHYITAKIRFVRD